ncbi:MAG: hypothetical protein GWO19_28485 [Nitrospinaceae bacterium]|nr:hypothetical protein [Nitrospinaceae bacterium]
MVRNKCHSIWIEFAMSDSNPEDELTRIKNKKETQSVIVALIAIVIIGISFVWHLWSALFPSP